MRGLGRVFDLGMVCPPAATNGAVTGKRIRLNKASGVAFVLVGGVATGGDDIQVDVQQYKGNSQRTGTMKIAGQTFTVTQNK